MQKHNIRSCGVSETAQSSLYLEHRVQTVNKGAEMSRRDWQEGPEGSLGRFWVCYDSCQRTLHSSLSLKNIFQEKKVTVIFKKGRELNISSKCQGYREPFWLSRAPGQLSQFADLNFEAPKKRVVVKSGSFWTSAICWFLLQDSFLISRWEPLKSKNYPTQEGKKIVCWWSFPELG